MNFEQYSDLRGTNWSLLRELARSPKHYQYRLHNRREDTPAMRLGRACHTAVLEPEKFEAEWTTYSGRRGTNDWKDFLVEHDESKVLTLEEYAKAVGVAASVHKHRIAKRLLRFGESEVSLSWLDPVTRIRCKARLDFLNPEGHFLDLKTTRTVEARAFGRLCEQYGYHGQMAFYRRGLDAKGYPQGVTRIIAVEAEPPHDTAVYEIPWEVMGVGDQLVAKLLHQLQSCRRKRSWPGAYPDVQELAFPVWALPDAGDYTGAIEVISS